MRAEEARAARDQHAFAGVIFPGRSQLRSPLESMRAWALAQPLDRAAGSGNQARIMHTPRAARTRYCASVRFCDVVGLPRPILMAWQALSALDLARPKTFRRTELRRERSYNLSIKGTVAS